MTDRERRAFNRGLEVAAKLAQLYADENFRMCRDSIHADKILMRQCAGPIPTEEELDQSEDLMIQGYGYAATAHACEHLTEMIRAEKVKR